MQKHLFLLFFSPLFFFSVVCLAEEHPALSLQLQDRSKQMTSSVDMNTGAWLVSIFRDHISKVDGDKCPSTPSCSSYGIHAFNKHGFVMGWLMTVDRLIHEADEKKVSPVVIQNGRILTLDPVENNDFWWFDNKKENKK